MFSNFMAFSQYLNFNVKTSVSFFSNFVAFAENLIFIYLVILVCICTALCEIFSVNLVTRPEYFSFRL